MPYVPENQRDTAYYIFNEAIHVRVNAHDTMSIDYIRYFGTPTSGVREFDDEAKREKIETYLTVAEMADHFGKGYSIAIMKQSDTVKVYERIINHLQAWQKQMQHGLNTLNAPIDDLILLDQLADAVYRHAKSQYSAPGIDSPLLRQLDAISKVSRESIIQQMRDTKVEKKRPEEMEEEVKPKDPERETYRDFFANYRRSGNLSTSRW